MIAAIGKNRELGKGGDLVWKISADLKRFKDLTRGHVIIMGRKTFESVGRPLPYRLNIIISSTYKFDHPDVMVFDSLEKSIKFAKNFESKGHNKGREEIFIIGGAQIFEQGMKFADRLYLTLIDAKDKDADTFFPEYETEFAKVVSEESGEENGLKFEYVTLEK